MNEQQLNQGQALRVPMFEGHFAQAERFQQDVANSNLKEQLAAANRRIAELERENAELKRGRP